jgi:hypothetical protein
MRRTLLLAVAALLTLSALLAIGILLFGGTFGETQGRILGTTAMLAGYGVLGIPAATLLDRQQAPLLAALDAAVAAAAAALAAALIWSGGGSETLGKSVATVTVASLAIAQTAALAPGRQPVRQLFAASVATALLAVALAWVLIWGNEGSRTARILGAVVVLDLLVASLQPILARARSADEARTRLRLHFSSGASRELSVRGRVERVEILAGADRERADARAQRA